MEKLKKEIFVMKYLKAIGYIAAAEVMSLFIGLTLATSSTAVIRFICAVCTIGILVCLLASFGWKSASEDMKRERSEGIKTSPIIPVTVGITSSLPAIISWIILFISHSTGGFDYYKWHKLINAYFLQTYNFINSDASTSALTDTQVMIMLPLVIIPFLAYIIPYALVRKGIISESAK